MTAEGLQVELRRANRRVNAWRAELAGTAWAAGLAAALALVGLSDAWLRYGFGGRAAACAALLALLAAALAHVGRVGLRRRTADGIAALLEKAFPQLDNRLINLVQFARAAEDSPLHAAYVRRGLPEWGRVRLGDLRDRRACRRARLALVAAGALLLAPALWMGDGWGRALVRVLAPFARVNPLCAAELLEVKPGSVCVSQGSDALLSCVARGARGQPVEVAVAAPGGAASVTVLGRLSGGRDGETFALRIPGIAAPFEYRFRAGDAPPSERFRVTVRAPLALRALGLEVAPPAYMGRAPFRVDALTNAVSIPARSRVRLTARYNRPLRAAAVALEAGPPVALGEDGGPDAWSGSLAVASGKVARLSGTDADGETLTTDVRFTLEPDEPPAIRVLAPAGPATLGPGAAPHIRFAVNDDYGVAAVVLERMDRAEDGGGRGVKVREWPGGGGRVLEGEWTGDAAEVRTGAAYRLTATDTLQPGEPNRTVSEPIVFNAATAEALAAAWQRAAAEAAATLARLVEAQRSNLARTLDLRRAENAAPPGPWLEAREAQAGIRTLAGQLLASPRAALGPMAAPLRRTHQGPMAEAIDALGSAADAATPEARTAAADRAAGLEQSILDLLTRLHGGAEDARSRLSIAGVLGMIDALVKNQKDALDATARCLTQGTNAAPSLVERQDSLASDVADFAALCRGESQLHAAGDKEFSRRLEEAAALTESRKLRVEMLAAAEHLEAGALAQATPCQTRALEGLQEIRALLNEWRTRDALERSAEALETVSRCATNLNRLAALQTSVVEALRETSRQADASGDASKAFQEDLAELKANMSEAALKIATDLQAFPELPVGNELVEDLFQVYEEMKQVPGSETAAASELGLQKEDWILETLQGDAKRMADMEMWLSAVPDNIKRNTENFDKQEIPAITVSEMPESLEDIIGDLLKQQEDIAEQSHDSVVNQGSSDMPAGWAIAEGEFVNYSAKGKSGNMEPDHKDADGRSGVGRQGMSDGETVAASGKIQEGDDTMDRRMTRDPMQSGQIQEEEHAEAQATGGGKVSGYSDRSGMPGRGPRRDSPVNQGSDLGLQAMLRRQAEAIYAESSLRHVRTGRLDEAVRYMRQAEDALSKGMPISQVREFQSRAIWALKASLTDLDAGFGAGLTGETAETAAPDERVAAAPDEAPPRYRDLVAEYYRAIGEAR